MYHILHKEIAVNPLDFSSEMAGVAHYDTLIWKKKIGKYSLKVHSKEIFSYCKTLEGLEQEQ